MVGRCTRFFDVTGMHRWCRSRLYRSLYSAVETWIGASSHSGKEAEVPTRLWLSGAAMGAAVATWSVDWKARAEVAPLSETQSTESTFWTRPKGFAFLSVERRKRMFFKYEKRIRTLSTPEKVFEYFSSIEDDGVKYMTAVDLLRALVPVYPPEGSPMERGGALIGEQRPHGKHTTFLHVFDIDGDNRISFHEYLTVLTLLSIPLTHIEVVFNIVDENSNGVIDKEEFEMVLAHIKKQSRQANMSRGGLRTGLNVGTSTEVTGLLVKFFGRDGTGKLKLPDFRAFLEDLQKKLLLLEFMHYDYNDRQSICGRDFARSLIAATDLASVDCYLQRVEDMDPVMSSYRIGTDQFISFYSIINYIPALETALRFIESSQGATALTPQYLQTTVKKLTGLEVQSEVAEILHYVFADKKGTFCSKSLLEALEARARF